MGSGNENVSEKIIDRKDIDKIDKTAEGARHSSISKNKDRSKASAKVKKAVKPAGNAAKNEVSQDLSMYQDDLIFAMDIGTRTVVGVVGIQEGDTLKIIATEVCEHKSRAMLDGQIHDIGQVALAVSQVRENLEKRLNITLKKVAIAAAGRVLKTCQVKIEKNIEQSREIDKDLVNSIEIEGIQQAQMNLDNDSSPEEKNQFYCVGYSIINYYLNGITISNLIGHKGKSIGADVLATFLPIVVVDSLYAVIKKVGLEVSSLTLEPIAAINAAIPDDLRLLNLALVDIGAGTSDIALTKDGSVIAYAMVPQAGDELTECLCQNYLVDFNTGEKIKIALSSGKNTISFTDIMKVKHNVSKDEVYQKLDETIRSLAETIADKILEYNQKAPNAVFLVGGGSRIKGLAELIARNLNLPIERVAVRGRDVIRNIRYCDKKLNGPESITPYGIAITSQIYSGKDFMTVSVNDKKIKLFNSKKLTVGDALLLYGFDASQLIGRTGKSISFYVDGEMRTVRGGYGTSAEIYLNGKPSSIDTVISYGDKISVTPAVDGKNASVRLSDIIGDRPSGIVRLNGNPVNISATVLINGAEVGADTQIKDGDRIAISQIKTLGDLMKAAGIDAKSCRITVNGAEETDREYALKDGDDINWTYELEKSPAEQQKTVSQPIKSADPSVDMTKADDIANNPLTHGYGAINYGENLKSSIFREEEKTGTEQKTAQKEKQPAEQKTDSGTTVDADDIKVTVNGKSVYLKNKKTQYIFVDIFNYIDFDLTKPKGNIMLKLNGKNASFTDEIHYGDVIDIYWG
jgi:cell division protein FtsA